MSNKILQSYYKWVGYKAWTKINETIYLEKYYEHWCPAYTTFLSSINVDRLLFVIPSNIFSYAMSVCVPLLLHDECISYLCAHFKLRACLCLLQSFMSLTSELAFIHLWCCCFLLIVHNYFNCRNVTYVHIRRHSVPHKCKRSISQQSGPGLAHPREKWLISSGLI